MRFQQRQRRNSVSVGKLNVSSNSGAMGDSSSLMKKVTSFHFEKLDEKDSEVSPGPNTRNGLDKVATFNLNPK